MTEQKICLKCVLPESPPEIFLNHGGVCNICLEYEKQAGAVPKRPLETDFTKILAQHRGKHEYDCMVMCSGGKDSIAALYYMKTRYKTKPLVFTFDHGFETEDAVGNAKRAAEKLGADFMLFRSDFMRDMFAKILSTGSKAVICHLCSIWYMDLAFKMAARFDIPIIIAGWTIGQSVRKPSAPCCAGAAPEFARMAAATRDFIDKHVRADPKYRDFPASMEDVLARARKRHNCQVLSPHWFLPYDARTYTELIKRELGWKPAALSYPAGSTNCSLNFVSSYNSMKYYGYTHYHVEMSCLIRQGLLSRDEALEMLRQDFDKDFLNKIAAPLGCRMD